MCHARKASVERGSPAGQAGKTRSARSYRFWKCGRECTASAPVIQR